MKKLLAALVFVLSFIPTSLYVNSKTQEERYVQVVQKSLPKVVTIFIRVSVVDPLTKEIKRGTYLGSGAFISSEGHILSCAHLFEGTATIESVSVETNGGMVYPAVVLSIDHRKDLSLLKIEEQNTPYTSLAPLYTVVEGLEVIAIGSPLGLEGTVTTGVISALHRDEIQYDQIQMSAPINMGNSGGPLFNRKGELVGVNVAMMNPSGIPVWCGLGFSVSVSEINKFLVRFKGLDRAVKARP